MDTISTLNSFLRTLLALVVIGGLSVAGYFGYTTYYKGENAAKELARI
jgi:hypothetical protein